MSKQKHHPLPHCQIFAHRGANREAMENTRAAFDRALHYAIDGIETDVQLSQDEVTVLWHDRFLNRIGLPDKHIDDFDYLQLRKLVDHESANENILTLEEFLRDYRRRCRLLLEIKNRDWEPVERHQLKTRLTLDLVGDSSADRDILVSSFNLDSLVYAYQYRPDMSLVYNFESDQTTSDARNLLTTHAFLYGLCLPIDTINQTIVDLLHTHDKCVAVYTCNSDDEINTALRLGVDILISDFPQKALSLRDQ